MNNAFMEVSEMGNPKYTAIQDVFAWDSGGGVDIDVVQLKDGRILGITEEVVILYESMDDLAEGDPAIKRPSILLSK